MISDHRHATVEITAEFQADRGATVKVRSEFPAAEVDTVITLCGEEECPLFLGQATRIHWELADPAGVEGDDDARLDAFRRIRDELRRLLAVVLGG